MTAISVKNLVSIYLPSGKYIIVRVLKMPRIGKPFSIEEVRMTDLRWTHALLMRKKFVLTRQLPRTIEDVFAVGRLPTFDGYIIR